MHVLAESSTIFHDMFSLPAPAPVSPSQDGIQELPIVPVSEESGMLSMFLDSITLGPTAVSFCSIAQIRDFYCVADKYVSDSAMDIARAALVARTQTAPFEVYLTACQLGLGEEARTAARHMLRSPVSELRETSKKHGVDDSHPALQRLWSYHEECGMAAIKVSECDYWAVHDLKVFPTFFFDPRIPAPPSVFSTQSRCCSTTQTGSEISSYYVKSWFLPFLSKLSDLLSVKPSGEDLGFQEWSGLFKESVSQAKQCPGCGPHAFDMLRSYSKSALLRVDSLVASVSDLSYPNDDILVIIRTQVQLEFRET